MLQRVAGCCSALQRGAVCCREMLPAVKQCTAEARQDARLMGAVVLQCVAVCCSVLQCVAACCSVSHKKFTYGEASYGRRKTGCASDWRCRVAVCCSALQCVAVRCSVLQRNSTYGEAAYGNRKTRCAFDWRCRTTNAVCDAEGKAKNIKVHQYFGQRWAL